MPGGCRLSQLKTLAVGLCVIALGCGGESYDGGEQDSSSSGATDGAAGTGTPGPPMDSAPGSDSTPSGDSTGTDGQSDTMPEGPDPASTPGDTGGDDGQAGAGDEQPADDDPADGDPAAPDCAPVDPWAGPGAEEICGDWVDDDCDGEDGACPTTEASVTVPAWDCQGLPPEEVLAWAPVTAGGGCGVIFGAAGAFYFAPLGVSTSCPSNFQERRHAWTTVEGDCETLLLVSYFDFDKPSDFSEYGEDFNYDEQPLSNECRKVLMYLAGDLEFSYLASSEEVARERLALFPQLEIGCHAWTGTSDFAEVELSKTPFMFNEGFVAPD